MPTPSLVTLKKGTGQGTPTNPMLFMVFQIKLLLKI
jgi:hypothetical protein